MKLSTKGISWSYLAGFFDGEGSLSYSCHKGRKGKPSESVCYPYLCISMPQAIPNKVVILEIIKFLKEKNIHHELKIKKMENPKWNDQMRLRIRRINDMRRFLKAINPYLILKKEKCVEALSFLEGREGKK